MDLLLLIGFLLQHTFLHDLCYNMFCIHTNENAQASTYISWIFSPRSSSPHFLDKSSTCKDFRHSSNAASWTWNDGTETICLSRIRKNISVVNVQNPWEFIKKSGWTTCCQLGRMIESWNGGFHPLNHREMKLSDRDDSEMIMRKFPHCQCQLLVTLLVGWFQQTSKNICSSFLDHESQIWTGWKQKVFETTRPNH